MTDFFADLEREIRAAHPRRPRPVVPVRGMALTAAVATTLVAIVLGMGALGTTESDVAAPPPQSGWTEYAPSNCENPGEVVDGRIPDEVVDRFAILRGDSGPVELDAEQVSGIAAEVIRQSLREIEGPQGSRYVFAVVRMADMNCEPADLGVCLISPRSHVCEVLQDSSLLSSVVDDLPDGRRAVAILADDATSRAVISVDRQGVVAEVDLETNTAFEVIPEGSEDVDVTPAERVGGEETIPLNCSTAPAMSELEKRLAIFRRPPDGTPQGFDVELPKGWHQVYSDEVREAGDDHYVFPATNASCVTGVCLVAVDDPKADCHALQQSDWLVQLERRDGDRMHVTALVSDEIRKVAVTSDGRTWEVPVRDNVVSFEASAVEYAVEPAS